MCAHAHNNNKLMHKNNNDDWNLDDSIIIQTKHPDMVIVPTVVAPIAIGKIVARLLLLLVLGERGPGNGFPVSTGKTVKIGYDTIVETLQKKKTKAHK